MALNTYNPTANTTPDPGQGGSAVSGNINTGHSSTTSSAVNGSSQTKTCVWQTFPAGGGQVASATLKFDWSENGSINNSANNEFKVEYSINGGGAWTAVFDHTGITSSTTSNSQVSLSAGQDLTAVRVRDSIVATASAGVGNSSSVTASISNIRVELVTVDSQVIVCV